MPELPEVQVVINYLASNILNKPIKEIFVVKENSKVLKNVSINDFVIALTGASILKIERNGKYLVFYLDNKKIWIVHLRMTGTFSIHSIENEINDLILKSTIAIFKFKDFYLRFDSTRKFSTFDVIDENEYQSFLPLSKVNYDPLNNKCDANFLYEQTQKSNRNIKILLLDQSVISGIGNIYADEILFNSNIHPLTKANSLSFEDIQNIIYFAKIILLESIKHNGTTIHSFSFNGIDSGEYQNFLSIHNPKIKVCKKCQHPISFIKIDGRGTYFCSKCQILK